MNLLDVARVAHEVNRAYCLANGDDSILPWPEAPADQIHSVLNGVRFLLEHPDATPAESHANWLRLKQSQGWTYGTEKDAEKRVHPCLVPYEQLPREQQVKDYLFHAVVRSSQLTP